MISKLFRKNIIYNLSNNFGITRIKSERFEKTTTTIFY